MKKQKFYVTGMTCSACERSVTKAVNKTSGVQEANVNLLTGSMEVVFDESKTDNDKIIAAVESAGYGATVAGTNNDNKNDAEPAESSSFKTAIDSQKLACKKLKLRVIISFILLVPLLYIAMAHMLGAPNFWFFEGKENALILALAQLILCTAIIIINKKFFVSGFKAIIHRSPNMDSLVAVGAGASYIYSIVILFILAFDIGHGKFDSALSYAHSLYFESAATILTLVSLGKFFESKSKIKTTSAIQKLMNLAPKTAIVLRDGKEVTIKADEILTDDILVIKTGDTLVVDGVVVEGEGRLNQAAITGESNSVKKIVGEPVMSASVCENGSFKMRATSVGKNTTLAKIIRLVEEASSTKAPISRIADKVSGWFVPIVMCIALLTFVVWLIAGATFGFALTCAVAVLVISCPCALGLATPVAIMVSTGRAASLGLLIKSAESLEKLHSIDTIILDKTGTITIGKPTVRDVAIFDKSIDENKFLQDLAKLEALSSHPLAKAIVSEINDLQNDNVKTNNFEEIAGKGVCAKIDGEMYYAGNLKLLETKDLLKSIDLAWVNEHTNKFGSEGKTSIIFVKNKKLQGIVSISDKIKEDSKIAIQKLLDKNLKVVMLTGDNKLIATSIAKEVGITEVVSDVLPDEKLSVVKKYQELGYKVAMVGDGINDSPALSKADVGIAVSSGSDIAIESADIVLTGSSLGGISTAIELSRATINNIKMNLFWAFFYNILGIPLAAGVFYSVFGWQLSPMIGSLAMSFSSVCVVLNALRLNFFKPKQKTAKNIKNNDKIIVDDKNNNEYNKLKEDKVMTKTIKIEGMVCMHCVGHTKSALEKIDGVSEALVSLEQNQAIIKLTKDVDDKTIISAVEEAGYTVTEIK